MSTAIKFENISKQYRLGLVSTRTLSHDLNRWWRTNILHKEDPYLKIGDVNDRSKKAESEYVWALRDIDFDVKEGDALGIIGKNGAGKSTLLKILSKVTAPTTGIIKAKGRIASLLEVGTGFHPEMTGRENIYMNGSIMGMTKSEITRKLDEIVDFSGVERYLDTPVKRYSSGMTVRLGFAIAAHLEPEILVVDEVLAVGDFEFQKKALSKMNQVSLKEGKTILFVSHDLKAVSSFCKKGLLLRNGMISYSGAIAETIRQYSLERGEENALGVVHVNTPYLKLKGIANQNELNDLSVHDNIEISLRFEMNQVKGKKLFFDFGVYNAKNDMIIHMKSKYITSPFLFTSDGEIEMKVAFEAPCLSPGSYNLTVYVYEEDYDKNILLWIDDIPFCRVNNNIYFDSLSENYLDEVKSIIFPKTSLSFEYVN